MAAYRTQDPAARIADLEEQIARRDARIAQLTKPRWAFRMPGTPTFYWTAWILGLQGLLCLAGAATPRGPWWAFPLALNVLVLGVPVIPLFLSMPFWCSKFDRKTEAEGPNR
jgi:hypothetical protein